MKPWFGSWPPKLPWKRQDDYLRRIDRIRSDLKTYADFGPDGEWARVLGKNRDSERTEDLTDRVRALCEFAEVSVQAWKELGWTTVMLDYAAALRRLEQTDCGECHCMPPWHKVSCSKSGAKVHWDGGVSL